MKVTKVEIFDLKIPDVPDWHPVVIRVHTDKGISGVGEVGLAFGIGHSAGAGMVKNLAEAYLIGSNPFRIEKMWDTMFRSSFWAYGGGPAVFGGMSAIDIAMWDIKGKALGLPVYELLGGKTNESLRCYASQIQLGWPAGPRGLGSEKEYADAARKAVADGYDCVKIDPIILDEEGRPAGNLRKVLTKAQQRLFYDRVKAVRDAVGPDVDIILDLHSLPSVTTGIQLGRLWEDLNCMYYEELVNCMHPGLQEKVSKGVRIPMAAGERLYTRWGYRQYFEDQSLDVIQPDLCLCGGITEGKKICDYANLYDISVQIHVCGSPVSTAAALQLEAVIPNFLIHEHFTRGLNAYNREICVQDYQPENGRFVPPDLPGLGIELNDEVVMKSPRTVVK